MTQKNNNWIIRENAFSADRAKAYEGLFTLGSDVLHVRGSLEEHLYGDPQNIEYMRTPTNVTAEKFPETKAKWGTYIPYIFGPHPALNTQMINLPFFLGITPFAGEEKLDMEKSDIQRYSRQLNMRTATLSRSMDWITKDGQEISVEFKRFVSAVHPKLCVQQMILCSEKDAQVTIKSGIDADVRTSGYEHFDAVEIAYSANNEISCSVNTNGGDDVNILSKLILPDINWQFIQRGRKGHLEADVTIPAGQRVVLEKRTAIATNLDLKLQSPEAILKEVDKITYEQLHEEHCKHWAQQWDKADVEIDGDDESQLAIRGSIYHLLRAQAADDPRVSVDAKGFSGDAYFGCYFWDTEMYIMPFFLYTDPQRAHTLNDFRVNTLDSAEKNASLQGYKGAKYPWFTDTSGLERCELWPYADHEIHITADVAYALAHYARAADDNYLKGPAGKVIIQTARFWMDRIEYQPGSECPCILGVMGPDEYSPITNNNAYTNALVAHCLDIAGQIGKFYGVMAEECREFICASKRLPILRTKDGNIILQHEDFEHVVDPEFEKLWKDRSQGFASYVSMEKLYRSKALKQADVLMLMYLLPHKFTRKEMLDAWDYYVPFTTHDSSLSAGVHSVLAARLGLEAEAWEFCEKSFGLDFDIDKGGAEEGMHIAGCGVNWAITILGFAGMKTAMETDVLTFEPHLPKKWQKISFPINWRGQSVFVELSHNQIVIHNKSDRLLTAEVSDETKSILPGENRVYAIKSNEAIKVLLDKRNKTGKNKMSGKMQSIPADKNQTPNSKTNREAKQ